MKTKTPYKAAMRKIFSIVAFLFGTLAVPEAVAEEETPWAESDYSKARLISSHKAVPGQNEAPLYVGLHVQLEKDWKTYWRSPGDAGVPPVIDWSGSVNVAAAELLYPTPQHFELFNLNTYGYHDEVVYPIRVEPAVDGAPVTLKATVNYLVCEDLCVPVSATFELSLPGSEGSAPYSLHSGLIDRYLAKVPVSDGTAIGIEEVSLLGVAGQQNLKVRFKGQNLMTGASVIAEDIEGFRFSYPRKRVLSAADEVEFIWEVAATGEQDNLAGKSIKFTVADGWGNYEEKDVLINP